MKLTFILFILVAWTILFSMHWVIYTTVSRVFDVSIPYAPHLLGVLSISYLLASIGVRTLNYKVADWFYVVAASWLGIVFLLFFVVLLYVFFHFSTGTDSSIVLGSLLVLGLVCSMYALLEGKSVIVKSYVVPLAGLEEPLRVVHLSDIHVGTVHQKKYLNTIVEKTNTLHPDIVLITGDLFDGSARIEEEILTPLNKLNAKAFFSNGNHEAYEGLDMVRETLQGLSLELLENTSVKYKGVEIIGINDRQSLPQGLNPVLKEIPPKNIAPRLLMYHSPVEWDVAKSYGVDMMFSGHTHNGQIFPFTLLVRLFFSHLQGLYEDTGKYLHVSPGTGTWGPPMRLGSRNQITLIELQPVR